MTPAALIGSTSTILHHQVVQDRLDREVRDERARELAQDVGEPLLDLHAQSPKAA